MFKSIVLVTIFVLGLKAEAAIPKRFECSVQGKVIFSIGKDPRGLNTSSSLFLMAPNLNGLFPQTVSMGPVIAARSPRTPSGPDALAGYQSPIIVKSQVSNYSFNNVTEILVWAHLYPSHQSIQLVYNPIYKNYPSHQGYALQVKCDHFILNW